MRVAFFGESSAKEYIAENALAVSTIAPRGAAGRSEGGHGTTSLVGGRLSSLSGEPQLALALGHRRGAQYVSVGAMHTRDFKRVN
jgi:hypothetical protein